MQSRGKSNFCEENSAGKYVTAFPELKMSGEFFEQRRKVEIFIKQAAEQAYHSAVYRRDDEVPHPMPSKRLKNASDIIAATARQDKSKQVLKRDSFMPNFPLTPLTKKS